MFKIISRKKWNKQVEAMENEIERLEAIIWVNERYINEDVDSPVRLEDKAYLIKQAELKAELPLLKDMLEYRQATLRWFKEN